MRLRSSFAGKLVVSTTCALCILLSASGAAPLDAPDNATPGLAKSAGIMDSYLAKFPQIVYSAHDKWEPIFIDNANERGGDLILLTMNGTVAQSSVLISGETRDPDVSYDGKSILFAWRGGSSGTDVYRIFEMDLATKKTRQITGGSVIGDPRHNSDVEPIYLPGGDIMFSSTRIVQMGDCLDDKSITANLYLCNKDGKYLRRIGYDQAHVAYPSVLSTGEVVYCRWDYNDKNHTYAHGLFVMNPDGSRQRELYGNNSWWPTALYYPRQIPGTNKVMAIIGGYHSGQIGQVGIIDPSVGVANGVGVTLLAPVRLPKDDTQGEWGSSMNGLSFAEYKDKWGPNSFDPALFPKPNAFPNDSWTTQPYTWLYPFDENAMLVCSSEPKGLYFMTANGDMQLLAEGSCATPVPVIAREKPPVLTSNLDWSKNTAVCQVLDIYNTQAPLLNGIARGTIKRLRVAGVEYRTGSNENVDAWVPMNVGPGSVNNGGATTVCPIARPGASWDVKWIIGETPVEADGSASFIVPARTPIYFQALDENGAVVQTMRSWATLMPGENNSCVGCHESKLKSTPISNTMPIAIARGPLPLEEFYGPARGFSFSKEIQPILNAKCVSCHNEEKTNGINLTDGGGKIGDRNCSQAYSNLVTSDNNDYRGKYVWWQSAEDSPLLQPPYRTGSCKSPLITLLQSGHYDVKLTKEELSKIRCWIDLGVPGAGAYTEGIDGSQKEATESRLANRRAHEALEKVSIKAFVDDFPYIKSSVRQLISERTNASINMLHVLFNASTGTLSMQVQIPVAPTRGKEKATMALYNAAGQCFRTASFEFSGSGQHTMVMNIGNTPHNRLPQGFYVCTASVQNLRQSVPIIWAGR